MDAQLFLEVACGLACVIITLLMWILFRTEKQNQEFRLRLGIMENDLQEVVDQMDVLSKEMEVTAIETDGTSLESIKNSSRTTQSLQKCIRDVTEKINEHAENCAKNVNTLEKRLDDSEANMSSLRDKIEESKANTSEITGSLQKSISNVSGRTEKMEEWIEENSLMSEITESTVESIRSSVLNLEEKMTTVPLHRYYHGGGNNHYYVTGRDDSLLAELGYVYEGVTGHLLSSSFTAKKETQGDGLAVA